MMKDYVIRIVTSSESRSPRNQFRHPLASKGGRCGTQAWFNLFKKKKKKKSNNHRGKKKKKKKITMENGRSRVKATVAAQLVTGEEVELGDRLVMASSPSWHDIL